VSSPSPKALGFARTLRRWRRTFDLTQDVLAARAGIGAKHLGEIERGTSDPRLTTIVKLLEALELDADELAAFWAEAWDYADGRRRR
jgi:predicted transcriptional regulator